MRKHSERNLILTKVSIGLCRYLSLIKRLIKIMKNLVVARIQVVNQTFD